jgi:hypothetical protein
MSRSARFFFFILLLAAGLTGCKPGPTANPKAPQESYNFSQAQVENRRYVSTFHVPVEIPFTEIGRQLNAQLPELLYEDDRFDDGDDLICKVWRRAPLTVSSDGTTGFRLGVPLRVWLRVRYGVLGLTTERETEFSVDVRLRTALTVQPDWHVQTQTHIEGYDWVTKPALTLGPVRIPVTGLVERALKTNQSAIEQGIDAAVREQVDLKPYVLQGWNAARQPYQLSAQYRSWLKITPIEVLMTPLTAGTDRVRATVGIRAYTESVFGEPPRVAPVQTVPPLQIRPQVPDEFQVGVVAEISHAEAQRLVADTMVGRQFEFQNGRYRITVTSIELYGSNDRLVVRAGVTGSINGHVYFKGVPTYDPATQTVYLDQFAYDLETRSLLVRTANWLLQGRFTRQMHEALTFPVGDQLSEARRQIQALLTRNVLTKGVTLNGRIDELRPERVYLTPQSILAVVHAKGRAGLTINGL